MDPLSEATNTVGSVCGRELSKQNFINLIIVIRSQYVEETKVTQDKVQLTMEREEEKEGFC